MTNKTNVTQNKHNTISSGTKSSIIFHRIVEVCHLRLLDHRNQTMPEDIETQQILTAEQCSDYLTMLLFKV